MGAQKSKQSNKKKNEDINDDDIIISVINSQEEVNRAKEIREKQIQDSLKKEQEEEKEKEKIIINDFIKNIKIHPKKIRKLGKELYNYLKDLNGFICSKCLKPIIVEIERNKEDNKLYIMSKCKDNHIEKKSIILFFNENEFAITEDFKFYDYVSSSIRIKEKPVKKALYIRRFENYSYSNHYLFGREDETYFICSKCKKIFDLKKSNFDKIEHEHLLFKYPIIEDNCTSFGNEEEEGKNHFFEFKDLDYLEQKVKSEKIYLDELKGLLNKKYFKVKYKSNIEEIELEIKFFKSHYNSFMEQKYRNARYFQNLFNIFNHQIIPFKLDENDLEKNPKLDKKIQKINNKLLSIYSLNTFENKEKCIISNYEQQKIKPKNSVFVSIELNKPYFASGGVGLFIFKIEENPNKEEKYDKHNITLVNQVSKIHVYSMVYLGNERILSGGINNSISIIKFDKEYKTYNFLLKAFKYKTIKNIIQAKKNNFISLEENGPLTKFILYEDKNKIEIVTSLKAWQSIINICDINKKCFAYQTNQYISIVNKIQKVAFLKVDQNIIIFVILIKKILHIKQTNLLQ